MARSINYTSPATSATSDVPFSAKASKAIAKNDLVCLKESGRFVPSSGIATIDNQDSSGPVAALTQITNVGNFTNTSNGYGPYTRRPTAINSSGITLSGTAQGSGASSVGLQKFNTGSKSSTNIGTVQIYNGSSGPGYYAVAMNAAGSYAMVAANANGFSGLGISFNSGTVAVPTALSNAQTVYGSCSFDAVCLLDGSLAVLYYLTTGVYVTRYDMTTGSALGTITLGPQTTNIGGMCLRARKNGGFLAMWSNYNSAGGLGDYFTVVDGTYTAPSSPTKLNSSSVFPSGNNANSGLLAHRMSAELSDGRLVIYANGTFAIISTSGALTGITGTTAALSQSGGCAIVVNEDDEIACTYSPFDSSGTVYFSLHDSAGNVIVPSSSVSFPSTSSASFTPIYNRIDIVPISGRYFACNVNWSYSTSIYPYVGNVRIDQVNFGSQGGYYSFGSPINNYFSSTSLHITPDGSVAYLAYGTGNTNVTMYYLSGAKSSIFGVAKAAAASGATVSASTVGQYTVNQFYSPTSVDRTAATVPGPKAALIGNSINLKGL